MMTWSERSVASVSAIGESSSISNTTVRWLISMRLLGRCAGGGRRGASSASSHFSLLWDPASWGEGDGGVGPWGGDTGSSSDRSRDCSTRDEAAPGDRGGACSWQRREGRGEE